MSEPVFPILDIYNKTAKISKDLIEEVRQKFLERVDKNPDLYYNEDVERVKTNDWTVRRYLYRYNKEPDVNTGLGALDKAMKWRKSFGVLDFNDTDISRECILSAGMLIYGKDLNGSQLILVRLKANKKSKTWRPYMDRIIVHYMEKFDRQNDENYWNRGITILTDSSETGLKNVDMDAAKFSTALQYEYYPGLVTCIIIYKMPTILEAAYKLFRSWLNEEQNKYIYLVDKNNLNNFVAAEQLPDFLKGSNTQPYRVVPEGVTTIHKVAEKYGIKKEKADKLAKYMEKFYKN